MIEKDDLVSVIVPVYNVERYINNCVNSIVSQTYTNLEIILVDDGSTDSSGQICECLKENDERIKVIHKSNGGLSDARNKGIDISTGKYIMFIDADDYIPDYSISYLYNLLNQCNAGISIGSLQMTKTLNSKCRLSNGKVSVYNNKEAIGQILYANIFSTSAPAKLYIKELFNEIRFPVGKLHEDLFTIYKVVDKAEKIVYGDEVVYFYYHRMGSITFSCFSKKRLDGISALNQLKKDIDINEYGIRNAYAAQLLEVIFSYFLANITLDEVKLYKLWDMVKENRGYVLFDKQVCKRTKGYALLSFMGLKNTMAITKLYYSRKWKQS